ncbi:MAG: HlyD family type I secretion periplasmic adaptor subunit [Rhodospirillales bacterium]|nr:MAG: HlyD family type I secretion periplasmic adaptor subunit [Rhodospirillales bacterium]
MAFDRLTKALGVWRQSVRDDRARPKDVHSRDGMEFLPAAIEVMESPPSPVGRALLWLACGFVTLGIAWAWFGEVDVVAVASGRVIPSGRVKLVQPAELGVVRTIHVREGQRVRVGDLLVELDTTVSGADRDRLARELLTTTLDRARLEALLASPANPRTDFEAPAEATTEMIDVQRRLMAAEAAKFRAAMAGLDEEEKRRRAQRDVSRAQIDKLKSVIPIQRENANAIGSLVSEGYAAKLKHNELKERLLSSEKDLATEGERLKEAEASLLAVREQRRQQEQEFRTQILKELSTATEKGAAAGQELRKATQRGVLQVLRAPVDGAVQQLAVHTVGGVVQPAETLMAIVPSDGGLEIEAMLQNKDVGFVKAGQSAAIKIEAFPYTIYGTLRGEVTDVSADAVAAPGAAQQAGGRPGARSSAGEPQAASVYVARVRLEKAVIEIQGKPVALGPGLAASVEIRTGTRTVLTYLLDPITRHRSESLRER